MKVKIMFNHYDYQCGDGCCDNFGIVTTVNGKELSCHNTDVETIVQGILQELGYEVEMINYYNGEEV
jgi:hypothetical protein